MSKFRKKPRTQDRCNSLELEISCSHCDEYIASGQTDRRCDAICESKSQCKRSSLPSQSIPFCLQHLKIKLEKDPYFLPLRVLEDVFSTAKTAPLKRVIKAALQQRKNQRYVDYPKAAAKLPPEILERIYGYHDAIALDIRELTVRREDWGAAATSLTVYMGHVPDGPIHFPPGLQHLRIIELTESTWGRVPDLPAGIHTLEVFTIFDTRLEANHFDDFKRWCVPSDLKELVWSAPSELLDIPDDAQLQRLTLIEQRKPQKRKEIPDLKVPDTLRYLYTSDLKVPDTLRYLYTSGNASFCISPNSQLETVKVTGRTVIAIIGTLPASMRNFDCGDDVTVRGTIIFDDTSRLEVLMYPRLLKGEAICPPNVHSLGLPFKGLECLTNMDRSVELGTLRIHTRARSPPFDLSELEGLHTLSGLESQKDVVNLPASLRSLEVNRIYGSLVDHEYLRELTVGNPESGLLTLNANALPRRLTVLTTYYRVRQVDQLPPTLVELRAYAFAEKLPELKELRSLTYFGHTRENSDYTNIDFSNLRSLETLDLQCDVPSNCMVLPESLRTIHMAFDEPEDYDRLAQKLPSNVRSLYIRAYRPGETGPKVTPMELATKLLEKYPHLKEVYYVPFEYRTMPPPEDVEPTLVSTRR